MGRKRSCDAFDDFPRAKRERPGDESGVVARCALARSAATHSDPSAGELAIQRAVLCRPLRFDDSVHVVQKSKVSTEEIIRSVCSCVDPESPLMVSVCKLFLRLHNFTRGFVGACDRRMLTVHVIGSTIKLAAFKSFDKEIEKASATLDQMFVVKRNGARVEPRSGDLESVRKARLASRVHNVLFVYAVLEEMLFGVSTDNLQNFLPTVTLESEKKIKINF